MTEALDGAEALESVSTETAVAGTTGVSRLAQLSAAALPLEQLLGSVLLRVLCGLPYPNTVQAAVRLKALADRLLTGPAAAQAGAAAGPSHRSLPQLLQALQASVHAGMLQWRGCDQLALLRCAGDAAALQLHGSFVAAAEAAVVDEVCRLLGQLLLGLEQHHVLDAYWAAGPKMQQVLTALHCATISSDCYLLSATVDTA